MAKVKTMRIFKQDRETRKVLLDCNVDVKVSASGTFYCELPEDVYNRLNAFNMLPEGYRMNGYKLTADTMNELESAISKAIEPLIAYKVIEDKIVIKYSIQTSCVYVKTTDGQFMPYGRNDGQEYEKDTQGRIVFYQGTEERDGSSKQGDYKLSILVTLKRKKTNEYQDGSQRTYFEHVKPEELGENGRWLRELIGMGLNWNTYSNCDKLPEIDYNEQNALFFRQFIIGIFKINEFVRHINNSHMLEEMIRHQKQLPI